ncbi:MAG TPA: hypothetical protein VIH59_10330, partial [Candidatus Tectomicrobia bacterium]
MKAQGYFLEYSYSAGTYSKDVGPVDLGFGTSGESATIAKDGNGSLWVAYDTGTNIKVVWSDPTDHTSTGWTTTNGGVTVNTAALEDSDDLAAIVAFDDKIGVLWSFHYADDDPDTDIKPSTFVFRVIQMDKDPTVLNNPVTGWSNEETVSKGIRLSDDHIHIALTDNNDLLVAT